MNDIAERLRIASPVPRPQSLCFDGPRTWLTSIETRRLYELDAATWAIRRHWEAPGTPWGMTSIGGELRLVCGEGEDENRTLRRFVPARGFDPAFAVLCPECEGSQLGWDGTHLHLNQWYRKRVLALDPDGSIVREYPVPHQICGQAIVDGAIDLVSTDDETTQDYRLTRLDRACGTATDLARIPFQARGLAFDGRQLWTCHREQHQLVAFERPSSVAPR